MTQHRHPLSSVPPETSPRATSRHRAWHEVTRRYPCPLCHKPDWCAISVDGIWAICRRVDTGAGIHRHDTAGSDYWLYRLESPGSSAQREHPLPPSATHTRADPVTLDRVYRALLAELSLLPAYRQALHGRGLSEAEQVRRRYRMLPATGRAALARRLVTRFGPDVCATVPGLYLKAQGISRWWSLAGAAGLLIPIRDVDDRIVALKVRADDPGDGSKYSSLSSAKYGGPGPGAQVHVPLHTELLCHTVRLTEGELKADVATALSGMLTLSVPGVSTWRLALPTLQHVHARVVHVAFDADWRTNSQVARALAAVAHALTASGVTVRVEVWDPMHGKGIDDLLAADHTPVLQTATLAFGAGVRARAIAWRKRLYPIDAEEVTTWRV